LKVAVVSTALGPGNIFTTPPLFYGGLEEVAALRARHLLEQAIGFTCLPLRQRGSVEGEVARLSSPRAHRGAY
jgi:hypothetical protein